MCVFDYVSLLLVRSFIGWLVGLRTNVSRVGTSLSLSSSLWCVCACACVYTHQLTDWALDFFCCDVAGVSTYLLIALVTHYIPPYIH